MGLSRPRRYLYALCITFTSGITDVTRVSTTSCCRSVITFPLVEQASNAIRLISLEAGGLLPRDVPVSALNSLRYPATINGDRRYKFYSLFNAKLSSLRLHVTIKRCFFSFLQLLISLTLITNHFNYEFSENYSRSFISRVPYIRIYLLFVSSDYKISALLLLLKITYVPAQS